MKVYAKPAFATAVLAVAALHAVTPSVAQEDVRTAPGWELEVFAEGLRRADNIVVTLAGDVYVSLEIGDGDGQVVRIRGEQRDVIARGLSSPDGLALAPPFLFITEEVKNGSVIRLNLSDLTGTTVRRLYKPEGIDILEDGTIIVVEDSREGRLLSIDTTGQVTVLLDEMARPEGVAVSPDGAIFVTETLTGRVIRWTDATVEVAIEGLDEPDQVELAADGALWITEDRSPGRLLRYHAGQLDVVADGLMAPQGIAFGPGGLVYVVEQGRDRVLALRQTQKRD